MSSANKRQKTDDVSDISAQQLLQDLQHPHFQQAVLQNEAFRNHMASFIRNAAANPAYLANPANQANPPYHHPHYNHGYRSPSPTPYHSRPPTPPSQSPSRGWVCPPSPVPQGLAFTNPVTLQDRLDNNSFIVTLSARIQDIVEDGRKRLENQQETNRKLLKAEEDLEDTEKELRLLDEEIGAREKDLVDLKESRSLEEGHARVGREKIAKLIKDLESDPISDIKREEAEYIEIHQGFVQSNGKGTDAFRGISVNTMRLMVWYVYRVKLNKEKLTRVSQLIDNKSIQCRDLGQTLRDLGERGYYENQEVKDLLCGHAVCTANGKKKEMAKELGRVLDLEDDTTEEGNNDE